MVCCRGHAGLQIEKSKQMAQRQGDVQVEGTSLLDC